MRDWIARIRGELYRLRVGFDGRRTIGRGLRLYKRLQLGGPGRITIGCDCVIAGIPGDDSQYVTLNAYRADAEIRIGDRGRLFAARIAAVYDVTVGDDVLIEESGIMDSSFHALDRHRGEPEDESTALNRVRIGNRVRVGARSIIMKGVTIGDDALVCPGSIVSRSIPPGAVAVGNPARPAEPTD